MLAGYHSLCRRDQQYMIGWQLTATICLDSDDVLTLYLTAPHRLLCERCVSGSQKWVSRKLDLNHLTCGVSTVAAARASVGVPEDRNTKTQGNTARNTRQNVVKNSKSQGNTARNTHCNVGLSYMVRYDSPAPTICPSNSLTTDCARRSLGIRSPCTLSSTGNGTCDNLHCVPAAALSLHDE